MAKALDWTLRLIDKMSGPAQKMTKAVEGLEGKLKGMAQSGRDMFAGFQEMSGGFLGDIYKGAFRLVKAGAELAIDAASFKEDSIVAFEAILHSREAANEVFDRIDALAGDLGLDDAASVDKMRQLMSSGFSADQAIKIIEQTANVAAARGEAAADKFATVLATFEAKGKFDTAVLNQMAKAGIRVEDVYLQLSKKLGKSVDEVRALAKAGKIDAAEGVEAILAATEKAFGGAAEKKAMTFSKLLFRVKDALGDLFQNVDLTPLKNALKTVLDVLGGPSGQALQGAISKFFGTLFSVMFKAFEGPGGQAKLERFVNTMTRAILAAAELLEKHGPFIVKTLDRIFTALGSDAPGGGDGKQPWWASVLMFFMDFAVKMHEGDIVGTIDMMIDAFRRLFGFDEVPLFSEIFDKIKAQLSELWAMLTGESTSVGSSISTGIASGITNSAGAVMSAIISLCSNAIAWAKAILRIGSPSKEFEGLGAFSSQGFAQGIANDNSAQDAISDMVAPPSSAAARAAGAAAAGGGGSSVTINAPVTIHVSGGGQDVAEVIEVEFTRIVETAARAVGA